MNTTNYAVIHSANGWTPSVQSKNSQYWFDFMQSGYEILYEGTKRECERYYEELISQLNEVNYYA